MEVFDQTSLRFAWLAGRVNFPRHSLSLVVKGTFDLHADGVATLGEEQPYPSAQAFFPDDEHQVGGPRYDYDTPFFKQHTDLLLVGKCRPPGGRPAAQCQVRFQVGSRARTLNVTGDRFWKSGFLRSTMSEPEPFTEMEIRYENSFGGPDYKKNPIGKGHGKVELGDGIKVQLLPNIEDPDELVDSPKAQPDPAGFGPLARMWEGCQRKLGTYDDKWLKERWPWFPQDLDWTHFNAAPEAMQVDGYLRGDEEISFENMHPKHSPYRSKLPRLRVRCFLNEIEPPEVAESEPNASSAPDSSAADAESDPVADAEKGAFREVTMNLDTLWVDAEAEKLVLVWRGYSEVRSEDYEEIGHLFIMSERLDEDPASLEECRANFLAAMAAEEVRWNPVPEEPEESEAVELSEPETATSKEALAEQEHESEGRPELSTGLSADADSVSESDAPLFDYEAEMAKAQAQVREACEKAGIDPDNPPPLTPEAKKLQARYMSVLGFAPDEMREAGIDPADFPPDTEEERKEQALLREKMGIPPVEEEPEEPEENAAHAPPTGEDDVDEDGPLTRARVGKRAARGDSLAGEDLRGLDLSKLQLNGIDLTGALLAETVLTNADLTGARLTGADLSAANLSGAILKQCDLQQADLTEAHLSGADLSGAVLSDTVLEKAILDAAMLEGVTANDAVFSEADLSGARLDASMLDGTDFSGCNLSEARFAGASLKEASFEGATGVGINMDGADLTELRASDGTDFTGGSFREVRAFESMWEEAKLDGADFSYARMEGADFTKASLVEANLYATHMQGARFTQANLSGARLVEMNLFEGSFEKGNLTGADLSGSNMYGVEFLGADTTDIKVQDTNLAMTKLKAS